MTQLHGPAQATPCSAQSGGRGGGGGLSEEEGKVKHHPAGGGVGCGCGVEGPLLGHVQELESRGGAATQKQAWLPGRPV